MIRLAYPDILPFGVEQLEDNFSDALRVGKWPQGGVQRAVHDTPVLQYPAFIHTLKFNIGTRRSQLIFSRPYWVVQSRLWYDVLSVCRLSVCNVLYCG